MSRNLGLDIIRSVAIMMVIVNHGWIFFAQYFSVYNVNIFGYLGVEIFFVLSGFLIGRILIRDVLEVGTFSSLKTFYIRRWLRTIPLYYLVILLLVLLTNREFHWQYLIFIHNFWPEYRYFFTVACSLSIEEWFYLIIPFILILSTKYLPGDKVRIFFVTCFSIIGIVFIARIIYVLSTNPRWDYDTRRFIFFRMDSLMIGVVLAGIKVYLKQFYSKLSNRPILFICLSFLGLVCIWAEFFYVEGGGEFVNSSFFGRTISFTIISVSVAFLIISLENAKFINETFAKLKFAKTFTFISKISYALYLVHYPIFEYMRPMILTNNIYISSLWFLSGLMTATFFAFILFKFFEYPIMNTRDRLTKNSTLRNFKY